MRKLIFSLLCCFIIMGSLTISVFAEEDERFVNAEIKEDGIMPLDVVELYRYGPAYLDGTTSAVTITPKAGTNLQSIVRTEGTPTIVRLWQNGRVVASINVPANTSSQTYTLYRNCNGGGYQLTITHYGGSAIMVGIFQTDYL